MEENKGLLAVTVIVVVVTIVALFGLLFIFAPESVDDEVLAENLYVEDAYTKGPDYAEVKIVTFEDFQCPACANFNNTVNELIRNYGDQIQFTHRHFPLSFHLNAVDASLAAEAAGAQGMFYEYGDILYERQAEWSDLGNDDLRAKLIEFAEELELEDMEQFTTDLDEQTYIDKINRDQEDGGDINVSATPTVYLNDVQVDNPSYVILERQILEIIGDQEESTEQSEETTEEESSEESN